MLCISFLFFIWVHQCYFWRGFLNQSRKRVWLCSRGANTPSKVRPPLPVLKLQVSCEGVSSDKEHVPVHCHTISTQNPHEMQLEILQKKKKTFVADRPSPPGKPALAPGSPNSQSDMVTIRWSPPDHNGGAPVTGKQLEIGSWQSCIRWRHFRNDPP